MTIRPRPFILGIAGLELTADEKAVFSNVPPEGIILFVRNIDHPLQLQKLIDEIHHVTMGVTKLYIDQEGGRVQRLFEPYWTRFREVSAYDELEDDAFGKAIYAHYRLLGDELYQAGFDVNCAPCLDMRHPMTATFLQDRTFRGKVTRLTLAANEARRGLMDAGIFPVAKHIPGHGRGTVDSHKNLPVVEFDTDPNSGKLPDDAEVFANIRDYPFGMCAHILYPQIDPHDPMTLSRKGFEFIRNRIGFEGIMLSDDLDMKALSGTQSYLARKSLEAGADLALSCLGNFEHIKDLYDSDLEMSENLHQKLTLLYESKKTPPPLSSEEKEVLTRDMRVR